MKLPWWRTRHDRGVLVGYCGWDIVPHGIARMRHFVGSIPRADLPGDGPFPIHEMVEKSRPKQRCYRSHATQHSLGPLPERYARGSFRPCRAWLLTVPALFPPLPLYPASRSPPFASPFAPCPPKAPASRSRFRFTRFPSFPLPYPTSSCPPASRSPSLPVPCTADRRGTQYTSEICAVIRCTLCGSKITVGLSTAVRFDCRYLGGCEPAEGSRHVCERCGASPIDGLPCYTHSRLLRGLNGYTPPNSSFAHAVPQHSG